MRGRVIILIGAIVLLGVVAAVLLLSGGDKDEEPTATETAGGEVDFIQDSGSDEGEDGGDEDNGDSNFQPADMIDIVVAAQNLPRGLEIPSEETASPAVMLMPWPISALPEDGTYFTDVNDVIGRIARTDLIRGAPILSSQVVDKLSDIAAVGSDAAAILPAGRVAMSIPLDPTGLGQVAYAIQDGDYVDVILSFLFIDVDEEFQTRLPNNVSVITRMETGELEIGAPQQGRQEPSTLSAEGVLVGPSEQQRPRLVTQRVISDAFVVHVGYFEEGGNFIGATPTMMAVTPIAPPPGEGTAEAEAVPTLAVSATPFAPVIITLAVTPQQALIMAWAIDAQIPITLTLRQAGDHGPAGQLEAVTLEYMIRNFNIAQPAALPFALEPPITSVRRFDLNSLYKFLSESLDETGQEQQ